VATSPGSLPRRRPPAVAQVVVLAVLIGVAAALLSRPVGAVGPPSPSVGGLTWNQLGELLTMLFLVVVGLWLFFTLRDAGSRLPLPNRVVATVLVMLLLGVLFVEAVGLVHFSPIPGSGNSTGSSNNTGGTTTNGSGNFTLPPFHTPGITLPAWAGPAVVLVVALIAGVFLVPQLVARFERRPGEVDEPGRSAREARKALQAALERLDTTNTTDARDSILALYARLLLVVEPKLGTVETKTPGEIRRDTVASLGVRSTVAQELTEIFEEARYSSHPMTAASVARARGALAGAIADLSASARVTA
jgi:uncharacterized protein DUF4129